MSHQRRSLFVPLTGFVIALLLAGSVFAPASLANAASDNGKKSDNSNNNNGNSSGQSGAKDDKNEGKDNDANKKCRLHKYDGKCDFIKPKITISSPDNKGKVTGPSITIQGNANDVDSGIKKVQMSIDGHGWNLVSTTNGDWSVTKNMGLGPHIVQIRAMDNAHNIAAAHVFFKVTK